VTGLPARFVLRGVNAMQLDGTFDGPLDIAVREGTIEMVARGIPTAADTVEHNAEGVFVMPGICDCHTHLMAASTDPLRMLREPISLRLLEAVAILRETLWSGVTCARDAAGVDAGVREALARGHISGPLLQVSIVMLSRTGGHGDGFLAGCGCEYPLDYLPALPGRPPHLVDGPDDMRRVVRQLLRAGADWIKLATTGGIASDYDDPLAGEFSQEEIATAVAEAALRGKRVMVHAYGGEGIDRAVAAGVASVEHGTLLAERQAREMAAAGTYLVPTVAILEDDVRNARNGVFPPHIAAKALEIEPRLSEAVRIAHAYGVPIALGSDAVRRELQGQKLTEIGALRRAGLPPAECLLAATSAGAELLGVSDRRGRLQAGYVADLLLLDRDPSDCTLFDGPDPVAGVIQAGQIVRAHPALST
jgi:imidazolonepropionase-like amidohydrolase